MIIDHDPKQNHSGILHGDFFVLVCLDGYDPQLGPIVVETIREQDDETLAIMWDFACDCARAEMRVN